MLHPLLFTRIGRAIAKGLAAEGVLLAASARRQVLLEMLSGEIERDGGSKPHLIATRHPGGGHR